MIASAFGGALVDRVCNKRMSIIADMRGRVFGAITAVALCAAPLGVLIAGPLTQWLSADTMFVITGGSLVVVAILLAFQPALRKMDKVVVPEEPGQDIESTHFEP